MSVARLTSVRLRKAKRVVVVEEEQKVSINNAAE